MCKEEEEEENEKLIPMLLHIQAYWAGALHLFTPLPFRPGRGGLGDILRTHFFLNIGNVDNFDLSTYQQPSSIQISEDLFAHAQRLIDKFK